MIFLNALMTRLLLGDGHVLRVRSSGRRRIKQLQAGSGECEVLNQACSSAPELQASKVPVIGNLALVAAKRNGSDPASLRRA